MTDDKEAVIVQAYITNVPLLKGIKMYLSYENNDWVFVNMMCAAEEVPYHKIEMIMCHMRLRHGFVVDWWPRRIILGEALPDHIKSLIYPIEKRPE